MTQKWQRKSLGLAEWSSLQDAFANLEMVSGAPPNLAMFIKGRAGDDAQEIYITGPGIEAIEARSPGGWIESEAPSGDHVSLLVGEGDPWSYFGINAN